MRSATTKTVMAMIALSILGGEAMSQTYIARFNLSGLPVPTESSSNRSPTSNAGADQSVASAATVTLNGSASADPDAGDTLTYAWSQVSGPGVTLSDPTAVSPGFTAPTLSPGDPDASLVFSLIVTDNGGAPSASDTVTITVSAPAAPATCETSGQTCADGTAVFAQFTGGAYIYASGIYPPAYWHVAKANCEALGAGWKIFEANYKNALALPGDPFGVDFTAPNLWGKAGITGMSSAGPPTYAMLYTWSSYTWNIATSSGNGKTYPTTGSGNFDTSLATYTPSVVQAATEVLGTHSSNIAPPENTTMSRPYVCMLITTSPLPS